MKNSKQNLKKLILTSLILTLCLTTLSSCFFINRMPGKKNPDLVNEVLNNAVLYADSSDIYKIEAYAMAETVWKYRQDETEKAKQFRTVILDNSNRAFCMEERSDNVLYDKYGIKAETEKTILNPTIFKEDSTLYGTENEGIWSMSKKVNTAFDSFFDNGILVLLTEDAKENPENYRIEKTKDSYIIYGKTAFENILEAYVFFPDPHFFLTALGPKRIDKSIDLPTVDIVIIISRDFVPISVSVDFKEYANAIFELKSYRGGGGANSFATDFNEGILEFNFSDFNDSSIYFLPDEENILPPPHAFY